MRMSEKQTSLFSVFIHTLFIISFFSPNSSLFAEPALDSVPTADVSAIESSLFESFIELQVSKNKGDHFYKVMMDEEERPYLNVEAIVSEYLKTGVTCNVEKYFCEVTINFKNRTYWIDGLKQRSSILNKETDSVQIPSHLLVRIDGNIWLRYDYWPQWLPVSIKWDLNNYHLDFFPMFPLLDELKQKRSDMRRVAFANTKEQELIKNLPAKEAENDFDTHFRYRLEHERYFDHEELNNQLDIALNLDLWKGTLLATGSYLQQRFEGETINDSDGSWRYSRFDNRYFYQYEMGHLNLAGSLLIPFVSLENALHIRRLKSMEGVERMRFHGLVQPGTEIDLYYKSFLIDTVTADSGGLYKFDDLLAAGGEEIRLNFYYPDGSSKEETMQIAADDGSLIKYQEWDAEIFYGSTETTRISMLNGYYGLFDNLTLGLHNTQYEIIEKKNVEEPTSNIAFFSLAWRVFYGMNIKGEYSNPDGSSDSAVQVNLSYFQPHTFRLLYRSLHEKGDLWDQYTEGEEKSTSYLEIEHFVGLKSWFWRAIHKQWADDEEEKTNLTVMYRINRNISIFWNPIYEKRQDDRKNEQTVGVNFGSTFHTARLSSRYTEEGSEPSASYRFSGKEKYPWSVTVGASQSTDGEQSYSAQVEYRFSPRFSTEARKTEDESSASVAWRDIWVLGKGPDLWEDFATGTLYGKVFTQSDQEAEPEPVEGAIVKAKSKKAITDEKGYYSITGLPAYDRIKVSVDPGSLEIDLAPEKELEVVIFRPGTSIEHNIEVVKSIGIDGRIEHAKPIPGDAVIDAVKIESGKVVAAAIVESDGFFIIEGLAPGKYLLRLGKVENPPEPFELNIDEGLDWISDIVIEWR